MKKEENGEDHGSTNMSGFEELVEAIPIRRLSDMGFSSLLTTGTHRIKGRDMIVR